MRSLGGNSRGLLRNLQTAAINARNVIAPGSGPQWQKVNRKVRMLHVSEPTAGNVPDADFVFATAWQTSEYVVDYPKEKGEKFYIVMDFDPWIAAKEVLEKTWNWPLKKITISEWLYEKVCRSGCPPASVTNIPIGINLDDFQLLKDITKRPKRIAMLYSKAGSKGSEDGLAALEICREKHPDLDVVLFGPTMRSRPANLPSWVSYEGNVSQHRLTQLFNSSSIYVCSSLVEGFALPPAEAMACGCAVAATDCGGIREFARNGSNILLSAPRHPQALAQNILRLLDDEELRISLARAGHESIRSFTWSRATDRLEQFVLNGRTPVAPAEIKSAVAIPIQNG
jgi:glycosyltransferase involved in cell wall biosynthesis